MQMFARSLLLALLLAGPLPGPLGAAESVYVVPVHVSAPPFRFDYRGVTGAVILADFELSEDGHPRNLTVRHGKSRLLRAAVRAIERWRFQLPDETDDRARIGLIFLFRRPQLLGAGSPVQQVAEIEYPQDEVPPQPRRIIEPKHPPRVATDGLAVVGLTVDERGAVTDVIPLYGPTEFVRAVEGVVRRWEFEPARQATEAVAAGIVVVVYFPRPTLAQPRIRGPR